MVLTRAIVPQMKSRKWGRVIHISSVMGLTSKAGRNSYSATKAALLKESASTPASNGGRSMPASPGST